MAYQSLYRKYRSINFDDIVGQKHITQTLKNAIDQNRVAHAYLFCGPRGTGKTSTARVLAKALNCTNGPTAEPCNVCDKCRDIKDNRSLDVIEIDAASNRNIDDIRQLREQVNYQPAEMNYKFYIVDEVHQLTRDSFNAFLKTLEEPPAHVVFVLCTTDPQQLPATILSRCQRFDFHRITTADIIERMRYIAEQEGWTVEDEAFEILSRAANGGLRDALSLFDQAAAYAGVTITAQDVRDILGGIDLDLLNRFSRNIINGDKAAIFDLVEEVFSSGKDIPQLVTELVIHWRNLLRAKLAGSTVLVEMSVEQQNEIETVVKDISSDALMAGLTFLSQAAEELRFNTQQRILLELFSLRIVDMIYNKSTSVAVKESVSKFQGQTNTQQLVKNVESVAIAQRNQQKPVPIIDPHTISAQTKQQAVNNNTAIEESMAATDVEDIVNDIPEDAVLTFELVAKNWVNFLMFLSKHPVGVKIKDRVASLVVPVELDENKLLLSTTSNFLMTMIEEKPEVKVTLEQFIKMYFHGNIITEIIFGENDASPTNESLAVKANTIDGDFVVTEAVSTDLEKETQGFVQSIQETEVTTTINSDVTTRITSIFAKAKEDL